MKVVILAGGFGTRILEETHVKPKPMVEIGDRPILWHILKIYSYYGFHDFIICLGYKGHVIKRYFADYFLYESDITFDYRNENQLKIHHQGTEPWSITLVDTGKQTMTGGRLKRIQKYVGNDPFMLTYGDGLSNINIQELLNFHQSHGKLATVTAVHPPGRYGSLQMGSQHQVHQFKEKANGADDWINGGFFIFQPEVFRYIDGDDTVFEKRPLEQLAQEGQLQAYKHTGFWYAMDTLRDKDYLEELWKSGKSPWKLW